MFHKRESQSQIVKKKARRTLSSKFSKKPTIYVADTSVIIHGFFPKLLEKGLCGKIVIPNTVMSELIHLANKGKEEGFRGLEEIAKLHKIKNKYNIKLYFRGKRPSEMQIKLAKSGEVDAAIVELAKELNATLVTCDLVQAKTAQAYGLDVVYLLPPVKKEEKNFVSRFIWLLKNILREEPHHDEHD